MPEYETIDAANEAVAKKIIDAQPTLVDGPPIAFADMPDPVQGAAIGAVLFEGWADDEQAARRVCEEEVEFAPNHHFGAVGAMGGILSGNLPVFVVENVTDGNRA